MKRAVAMGAALVVAITPQAHSTSTADAELCFDCDQTELPDEGTCELFENGPISNWEHKDKNRFEGTQWAGDPLFHGSTVCGSCEERHWECGAGDEEALSFLQLAFGHNTDSMSARDREAILTSTIVSLRDKFVLDGNVLTVELCGGKTEEFEVPETMLKLTTELMTRSSQ